GQQARLARVRVEPARYFLARLRTRAVLSAGKYPGGLGRVLLAADGLSSIHRFPEFRISDACSEPDSNNLPTSFAAEPAALQVGKNFCGHRFFRIEDRVRGKTVNSNRDQDIAFENMQHCHASLVRTEDGFITKTVDTSRFAAIGGQHGKHCLSKMRRSFSPRIENVEIEPLIAVDRMITPFRIVVAT